MLANFGYRDGSGEWFIVVNTDMCDGCGECVDACPASVLDVGENEYDPLSESPMVRVKDGERNRLRYSCAPCRPGYGQSPAPCVAACEPGAISHSEGWMIVDGNT